MVSYFDLEPAYSNWHDEMKIHELEFDNILCQILSAAESNDDSDLMSFIEDIAGNHNKRLKTLTDAFFNLAADVKKIKSDIQGLPPSLQKPY